MGQTTLKVRMLLRNSETVYGKKYSSKETKYEKMTIE
jgi:hypothetical protein